MLGINATSRHPRIAWRLVQFLTSPTAQRRFTRRNGLRPTRRQLYRDAALLREQPMLRRLRPIIDQARPRPVTPYYMMVSQILQSAFSAVVTDQATPRQAFRAADEHLARILAAELR